jgi:uncharacterized repeat protein (TIGR03803 family)
MTRKSFLFIRNFAVCFAAFTLAGASWAAAQTETVIHAFQSNSVTDGAFPAGGLVADGQGALYGTTTLGGKNRDGTVYKLSPPTTQGGAWKQNILYSFANGSGGASPSGNLILATAGRIYGAATGEDNAVVFEIAPPAKSGEPWTQSVVYQFFSSSQALAGISSLISDGKGRIYGTTYGGGRYKSGSVFVLTSTNGFWQEQDIYSFQSSGGTLPAPSGLVLASGVLYGVTSYGGTADSIAGTVFSLTAPSDGKAEWTESVIHEFGTAGDGTLPSGTLVLDNNGAIYGTTEQGGETGSGTVFQLNPPSGKGGAWTENILYSFLNGGDGAEPFSGVIFDSIGALYGTTQLGGDFACNNNGFNGGCGTAFKLIPPMAQGEAWTEQTLYAFAGASDGVDPGLAPLLLVSGTTLYGTTFEGGDPKINYGMGCGTVFEITQSLTPR